MPTLEQLAADIVHDLLAKSGVREWADEASQIAIAVAARKIANVILHGAPPPPDPEEPPEDPDDEEDDMALPDYQVWENRTAISVKASGGDFALTSASLANGSARQSAKITLNTKRAQAFRVFTSEEIAATPTAGATIDFYWAPSNSGTAGTDNMAGISGSDAAYSGYSSNLTASIKQLIFIGSLVTTAQATSTVQKGFVGSFIPPTPYGSMVKVNNSGAALHSADTNIETRLVPDDLVIEDTNS